MIVLNIIACNIQMAIEIVDFLTVKKLVLDAVIAKDVIVRKQENKAMVTKQRILIMGKTKSLLFDMIDKELREKYKEKMPVLYSVPIVQMDWEQADELVKKTAKV